MTLAPRAARAVVVWLVRRRTPVLACALLTAVAGAWGGVRLYSDLRSGIEELLPDRAPSVRAAHTVGPRLHDVTHLAIVLEGPDGTALQHAADRLVARLRALPAGSVGRVEHRVTAQRSFLQRNAGLYPSLADLASLEERVNARVAWEKARANPLIGLLDDEPAPPAPALGLDALRSRYGAQLEPLDRYRDGYLQTPDGHLLVVLVTPPDGRNDLAANQRLLARAQSAVASLDLARAAPGARVGYGGEVAALVEEQAALVSDLASSTAAVLALVLLVLWWFFRRWTLIASIGAALAVGCAVTFGLSRLLVGHLNANTAFLGSILVGNGINVSILLVARYAEERRRGRRAIHAIEIAWGSTLAATFVASFAAGLAYLSLAVTQFRGFSQFGVIAGLGMALCWVAAYSLLPPILFTVELRARGARVESRPWILGTLARRLVEEHGRTVLAVALGLLVVAGAGVATYRGDLVEYDLNRLRAAHGERTGAQHWNARANEVFRAYLTPIVVHAETEAALARVVTELERERRQLGAADPIREIRTVSSLVPPDQAEKIAILQRLRDQLTDARLARLPEAERALAARLRPPADLRPFTLADVPDELKLALVERDGTAGRVALVFPRKVGSLGPREVEEMTGLVRGAIERSGADAQAVGQALLFGDIASSILRDGPRATALALVLVCALVAGVLRRRAEWMQVCGALLLGVAWLVGAAALARVRLNFLNFVVLPITFGIGVDYAVNVVQRWRADGARSLGRVLEETGGAVALCSMTTMIGYGSLLLADNRALRGFGVLASLAELACLAAAVLVLPAWLQAERSRRTMLRIRAAIPLPARDPIRLEREERPR